MKETKTTSGKGFIGKIHKMMKQINKPKDPPKASNYEFQLEPKLKKNSTFSLRK